MASEKTGASKDSINVYVVKCVKCEKWRVISTKEEYETIRDNILENLWFCDQKPGVSCNDPADIEYSSSRIWVNDKPNIPKTPPNTERIVTLRQDFSQMDTCYLLPNGQKASCTRDVEKLLEEFPEYKDSMSVSSFDFDAPKVLEETISNRSEQIAAARAKKEKVEASDNTARTRSAKTEPSDNAARMKSAKAGPLDNTAKVKSTKVEPSDNSAKTKSAKAAEPSEQQ